MAGYRSSYHALELWRMNKKHRQVQTSFCDSLSFKVISVNSPKTCKSQNFLLIASLFCSFSLAWFRWNLRLFFTDLKIWSVAI
jgi:hypothetical protein